MLEKVFFSQPFDDSSNYAIWTNLIPSEVFNPLWKTIKIFENDIKYKEAQKMKSEKSDAESFFFASILLLSGSIRLYDKNVALQIKWAKAKIKRMRKLHCIRLNALGSFVRCTAAHNFYFIFIIKLGIFHFYIIVLHIFSHDGFQSSSSFFYLSSYSRTKMLFFSHPMTRCAEVKIRLYIILALL